MSETHDHWFEQVADHLRSAYLRYSFTKGTEREVRFLVDVLGLEPGMRVLDVGCGPGRHALALAALGIEIVGVDISQAFVDIASATPMPGASFVRANARTLAFDAEFDAAYAMCQGAFGLQAGPAAAGDACGLEGDRQILGRMTNAVRPGGRVGIAAFSAYFQVRNLEGGTDGSFDARSSVHHEITEIRDPDGAVTSTDLWTTCFTPRELVLLAESVGLEVVDIWSVMSGSHYDRIEPHLEDAEFFMCALRPEADQ